jgi:hypothetical protein
MQSRAQNPKRGSPGDGQRVAMNIDHPPEVRRRPKSSSFEPPGAGLGSARKAKTSQVFGSGNRLNPSAGKRVFGQHVLLAAGYASRNAAPRREKRLVRQPTVEACA